MDIKKECIIKNNTDGEIALKHHDNYLLSLNKNGQLAIVLEDLIPFYADCYRGFNEKGWIKIDDKEAKEYLHNEISEFHEKEEDNKALSKVYGKYIESKFLSLCSTIEAANDGKPVNIIGDKISLSYIFIDFNGYSKVIMIPVKILDTIKPRYDHFEKRLYITTETDLKDINNSPYGVYYFI